MIEYVTGVLGSGKSLYGARETAHALQSGRVVASNMRLRENWPELVLKHSALWWTSGRRERREMVENLRGHYHYEPDLSKLVSTRIHGFGERRGLMILDEAHNDINNRGWAKDNQQMFLRKLSLARKRGWRVLLLSQHKDNTDVSARRIAMCETRLVNWQQLLRVPAIGVQLLPFPLFLAITRTLNTDAQVTGKREDQGMILGRQLFRVSWYGRLYDTFEDYGIVDDEDDMNAVWLPRRVAESAGGVASPVGAATADVARIGGIAVGADPPAA